MFLVVRYILNLIMSGEVIFDQSQYSDLFEYRDKKVLPVFKSYNEK